MSMKTWKEKFYKTDASEYEEVEVERTLECVQHSLLKWEGLKPENC